MTVHCVRLTRAFSIELCICATTLGNSPLKSFGKPSVTQTVPSHRCACQVGGGKGGWGCRCEPGHQEHVTDWSQCLRKVAGSRDGRMGFQPPCFSLLGKEMGTATQGMNKFPGAPCRPARDVNPLSYHRLQADVKKRHREVTCRVRGHTASKR